ncbi:hypothetical protein JL107_13155 [Nakamurella flavida]|uniref:PA14 domain-containing protein n=1 Tax=Nakamurella flavida TaxID=363630 RepID=A0A938YGR8_9ACTN|nr:RHS repeat-associated core domain-containing protein [Nakamurella flavida]MBM9477395.1 hypothetical protein [Nakamurella flavida]MDP9777327.1 RHS repeat-associated protein [Nakamurella flavida]
MGRNGERRDRPVGIERRGPAWARRGAQAVVIAVTASMVATGVSYAGPSGPAATPAVASAAAFTTAPGGDPTTLSWAGGTTAGGQAVPDQAHAVVTQTSGLATSLTPALQASTIQSGLYSFTVGNVATGTPVGQFTLSSSGSSVRIPAGKLSDGSAYQWSVTAPDGSVAGPFLFRVDTRRAGLQATDSIGALSVALGTGEVATAWTSQSVSSAAGTAAVGLSFEADQQASPGLPTGWAMTAGSASPYRSLTVDPGGAVDLHQVNGATITYRAAAGQAYLPVWGTGEQAPTATLSTVVRNGDGTWTVTDPDGTTTVFGATPDQPADANPVTAQVVSVTAPNGLGFGQTWSGGLLTAITDPVSGQQITLQYGPQSGTSPAGFVPAPAGMLSGVTFWDGSHARVLYVPGANGTVQIGRLVADSDAGPAASVTDYGWDAAGRLAVLRSPTAAAVLAAGVPGYQATGVTAQIGYDDQGRVDAVLAPAAAPGGVAVTRHYAYALTPADQADPAGTLQTTITQDGANPPAGFVQRVATDPVTLLPMSSWDADGRQATTTWDPATDHQLVTTASDGSTTTRTYDPVTGLLSKVVGPVRGTADGSTPTVTYGYDQTTTGQSNTSAGTTKPIKGLLTQYWANPSATGAPSATETGPQVNGAAVSSLAVNWPTPPVATTGGWSARMTGTWQVDAAGTDTVTAGPSGAAALWIDGVSCPGGTCTGVALTAGLHSVRIDLSEPSPTPGGAGSVSLAAAPTGQQPTPIPLDHLHPGTGRQTSTSTSDALDGTSPTTLTSTAAFGDAQVADPTTLTSPSGLTGTRSFEPVDPAKGQFGRETGLTSPAGDTTTLGSWGGAETATAPGTTTAVNQAGLTKTVSDPARSGSGAGPVVSTTYHDAAGRSDAVVTAEATVSTAYDPAGRPTTVTTTPTGADQPVSTLITQYDYQGDPLQTATTSTVHNGDGTTDTRTSITAVDLAGRTVFERDGWGTTSATTYDPVTGQAATTTTTSAPTDGAAPTVKTTSNTYNSDGTLHGTSVTTQPAGAPGSTVSATLTWAQNGDLQSVAESNGAVTTYTTDADGRTSAVSTTTGDHQVLTDSRSFSPAGRVLAETLATPGHQSAYSYRYDVDQRLTAATLTTDQTVSHTGWAYTYDADSNRTAQTVTNPDGSTATYSSTYDPAGSRLTGTTDPAVGALTYDTTAGSDLIGIGATHLAYDAEDQLVSVIDQQETTSYQRDAAGTIVARTSTPSTGAATTAATTERYTLDGLTLDNQNHLVQDVTTLPGGVTVSTPAAGVAVWSQDDLGGAAWVTLTATGTVTGTPALYDPFGQLLTGAPADGTVAGVTGPDLPGWGVGMTAVPTTGPTLLLDGARVYVPALGRFTTPDPQVGGSANPYDYANQEPITTIDPTGQSTLTDVVGAVVGTLVTGVLLLASAFVMQPEIAPATVVMGRATATLVSRALLRFMVGVRQVGSIASGALAGAALGTVGAAAGDAAAQLTGHLTQDTGWSWSKFGDAVASGAALGAVLGMVAGPMAAGVGNYSIRFIRCLGGRMPMGSLPMTPPVIRTASAALWNAMARGAAESPVGLVPASL